jgi:LacI family transcriptional regulator
MSPVSANFLKLSVIGDILASVIDDILGLDAVGTATSSGEGEALVSTMRDVALRAGVSAKTVSRVMNNDRYVSDDVRTRVLAAVEELDYIPNAMARTFRSGQDTVIGIAVPDVDSFFGPVIQAVEGIARARGVSTFVSCLGEDPQGEQAALETLLSRHLVGLLITPIGPDQSYLKPWRERTCMMFVDRRPKRLVADSVIHDDIAGARLAIMHLVDHGHRRIAFVGDELEVASTARRRNGYESTLFDAGIGMDPFLVALGAHHRPVVQQLLALPDPPTAIFSANPECSQQVVRQLLAQGRRDITVIGFGDFPMADALDPPVTVVEQDPLTLGARAVDLLFQRVDEPDKRHRRQTVLPVRLIPRGCCELVPANSGWRARGS